MLHVLAGCANALSLISAACLLFMLASVLADRKFKLSEIVWQVPAVFVVLTLFWAAVGYGLNKP